VRHIPIGIHTVSIGCLTASLASPRSLPARDPGRFRRHRRQHNHPSSDPEPSAEDLALTRRLAAAGSLLGIEILDHIITGDATKAWVSLKDAAVESSRRAPSVQRGPAHPRGYQGAR
jgi:DNA repair protein RadC